jgi:hypothetical protein
MPAYAKISLVTSQFYPVDIAFVLAWSRLAPGFGGWQVAFDREPSTELVSIVPPGAEDPVFVIRRPGVDVVMHRNRPDGRGEPVEVGHYKTLRDAVLALCPLSGDALEEIHVDLETRFPRYDRD